MHNSTDRIYKLVQGASRICTDSRNIKEGDIFFALKGEKFDGNRFAQAAVAASHYYAVIDDPAYSGTENMILVNDVLEALQNVARLHRKKHGIPVIGITGSNGKTTTKELIRNVLSKKFRVTSTAGNLNNHIGVPLTVMGIGEETDVAVVEMGANHIGEIAHLCSIADPNLGLITNIGKAHLEGFGDYQGVIKAKSELYHHLRNVHGHVFVHGDDDLLMNLSSGISRSTYGLNHSMDVSGIMEGDFPGITGLVSAGEKSIRLESALFGGYNFTNLLAAVTIGLYFKVPLDDIRQAIKEYVPDNMRSQVVETRRNKIYLDAYNANPASVAQALEYFASVPGDNKWAILGDMFELGSAAEEEHGAVIQRLSTLRGITVILIGPKYRQAAAEEDILSFESTGDAMAYLKENRLQDATILIKGSRGMKLERLLENL